MHSSNNLTNQHRTTSDSVIESWGKVGLGGVRKGGWVGGWDEVGWGQERWVGWDEERWVGWDEERWVGWDKVGWGGVG